MKFMKFPTRKISFESFLCGMPARDYINQKDSYESQIKRAATMIQNADYVLIGAGAGMSTAAGAKYGGAFFSENFAEFQEKYGKGQYMQDYQTIKFLVPRETIFTFNVGKAAMINCMMQ